MWTRTSKQLARLLKKHFLPVSFWLLGLTLPWQLGKHFWPDFSFINGLRIDYLSPTLYLNDLILWALSLAVFFKFKSWQNWHKPNLWFIGFLVFLLVNFLVSLYPGLFFYRLYQYAKIFTLIFLFKKANKRWITSFFQGLATSAILALILAINQVVNQSSRQGLWYFFGERSFTINSPGISTISLNGQKLLRAYAFFSHPNSLAGFFLLLNFVYLALKKPLLVIVNVLLVILAFSKFHLLLLAGGLLAWLRKRNASCRLCLLAKIAFIFWLAWFGLLINNSPESLNSRLASIWPSLQFVLQHPFGIGLGHYLYPKLPPFPQPIHNVFLLITIEWGWFIWLFLFGLLVKLKPVFYQSQLAKTLLVLLILVGSFDHYLITLNQNLMLLGVLLGLLIASWPKRQTQN